MRHSSHRRNLLTLVFVGIAILASDRAFAQNCEGTSNGIPMRVWDVITRNDRPWVFSVRTCQPRGLSNGSILLRRPMRPLPDVRKARVFSGDGGASIQVQRISPVDMIASFEAMGNTINTWHGPLVALLTDREQQGLTVGDKFDLMIDRDGTFLREKVEDTGEELDVPFCITNGTLEVVADDAPFTLAAIDDDGPAGGTVLVALGTYELWLMKRVEMSITYDPNVLTPSDELPLIWDYKADSISTYDDSTPGIITMSLESRSASVNLLPGPLFEIRFDISPDAPVGSTTTINFNGLGNQVIFRNGEIPDLDLRSGTILITE